MSVQAKRGFLPTDIRDFGDEALPRLHKAAEEVYYLLNRGYPVTPVTRFVGDRYQFSERQRLAIARTVSPREHILARQARQAADIAGRTICIDGFNVIIGLEIAFSESMLFRCMDGTLRDLAGLHGTYRLIPQTELAIRALLDALTELKVGRAVIYLDKPVSNSGRLKQKILGLAENVPFGLDIFIENPVDQILKTMPLVASGDAIILDECDEWFNLMRYTAQRCGAAYTEIDFLPEI